MNSQNCANASTTTSALMIRERSLTPIYLRHGNSVACLTSLMSLPEARSNVKESRGAHSREDFKKRDDENWMVHTLAYHDGNLKTPTYTMNFDKAVDLSLWEEEKANGVPEDKQKFRPKERVY